MRLSKTETDTIIDICKRNDISFCALFGSFARGEGRDDSDVDLLVKLSRPMGWEFYGIAEDLQESLGRKVDLATENMLNKYIRDSVLGDLHVIYDETK
ncbi:MAG: nucleotidyltransferase domain-containing protein [Acidobacteria bacterium]|nr:nucleotidyltransferase domain-containing protein [Acidobacteriota bacterium]